MLVEGRHKTSLAFGSFRSGKTSKQTRSAFHGILNKGSEQINSFALLLYYTILRGSYDLASRGLSTHACAEGALAKWRSRGLPPRSGRRQHACVGSEAAAVAAAAAAPMIDGPVRRPGPAPRPRRGVVSIYSLGDSDPRSARARAICRQQLDHPSAAAGGHSIGRQGVRVRVAAPALRARARGRGWEVGRREVACAGGKTVACK
jgi:hypothetical protein